MWLTKLLDSFQQRGLHYGWHGFPFSFVWSRINLTLEREPWTSAVCGKNWLNFRNLETWKPSPSNGPASHSLFSLCVRPVDCVSSETSSSPSCYGHNLKRCDWSKVHNPCVLIGPLLCVLSCGLMTHHWTLKTMLTFEAEQSPQSLPLPMASIYLWNRQWGNHESSSLPHPDAKQGEAFIRNITTVTWNG